MCDPLTILGLVGGIGSAVLGVASAPKPPPLPALTPPGSKAPGATVKIGTGADELENTDPTSSDTERLAPTRLAGTSLGGLGRSTLAL